MKSMLIAAAVLAVGVGGGVGAARGDVLIHSYEMNDATDALGGPSLVANGGVFGGGVYTFTAGTGLRLSGALPDVQSYRIDLRVTLDDTGGYKRLIDFKDLGSDTGLYSLNGFLNFYNVVTGPDGLFSPGTAVDVSITRDGAGQFTGSVNGVQQFSFADTSGLGVFDGVNGVIHFFEDDLVVPNEQGPGSVDFIRIYAVPEPGVVGMLGAAVVPMLGRRRR